MADIYAIQTLFGAASTRTSDTTYGFNTNAGATFDFSQYSKPPAFTIYDSGGNDTLDCGAYSQNQTIDLTPGAFSSVGGYINNIGIYLTSVIENAIGGSGADTIIGNSADNNLSGGAGNDVMIGGAGNDTYVVDNANDVVDETGGSGIDLVLASVTFNFSDVNDAKGTIENLTLTGSAAINGTGSALVNVITGNSGNNVLAGLAGADTLDGGGGTDTATYAASPAGVNVSLVAATASGGDASGDTLISIENLTGSNFDDTLEGNAGNNVLTGGSNGSGGDTVSYQHATAGVNVKLAATSAQSTGGAGSDTLVGFENLTGSAFNDSLTGKGGTNVLNGLDGNDTIKGAGGGDVITGGAGNDTFIFTSKSQSVPSNPDVITDFTHGSDHLNFAAIDASSGQRGNQAFTFGGETSQVSPHTVTWYESGGNTIVQADANGNSGADVTVVLTGINLHLTASDFLL
jgi:serralysin